MNTINLKEEVRKAVARDWEAFAASHPRLAAVLDQTLLVEGAVASLADDAEYRRTMAEAMAAGMAAEAITTLISRFVRNWMDAITR